MDYKKLLKGIFGWLGISLVLAGIIWFMTTVLGTLGWTYRLVFWNIFIWGYITLTLIEFILSATNIAPWITEYKVQLRYGKKESAAFDSACDKIKWCPPKWILKKIANRIRKSWEG